MRPEVSWNFRWKHGETPLGRLVGAGRIQRSRGTGFSRFRVHHSLALVLSLEGSAFYRDDTNVETQILAGDCLWVTPEVAHQYGPVGRERWGEIYLEFEGAALAAWFARIAPGDFPVQRLGSPRVWLPRWLAIAEARPDDLPGQVQALSRLHLLLADLIALRSGALAPVERLESSRLQLEAWPAAEAPDWSRIAAACGYGYDAWRRAFRGRFGVSPARHRRRFLMETAAPLVVRSNLTNDQLATQFGCADAFHFSRLFKAEMGVAPREFRRRFDGSSVFR